MPALLCALCCAWVALPLSAAESIAILPSQITLTGPGARQPLLVGKIASRKFAGELTAEASISSSNPDVVRIENGVAVPAGNGTAKLSARWGNKTATVDVAVAGMEEPLEWSFRNHIQPVLARAGCSAGACHGAAAGQNGFSLSLRGYDDEGDFLSLTRHAFNRRVNPHDPARSLLLLKATAAIPHKGGQRFDVDSLEYKVLADWIASGTPGPKAEDPRIHRIEIIPEHVMLKPGETQQLLVRAHFSNGHVEDVTHWAKFTSANASVTEIDDHGRVTVLGNGEGAITAWYLSRIAIATVTVPYTNRIAPALFTKAPRRNLIDELVLEKLQSLNAPPSPRCSDSEFLRRAYLDTIGVLPTPDETRAFLAGKKAKKRDHLIEQLLQRPEYIDYWTHKWSDLLLVSSRKLKPAAMWGFHNWVRNNVAANTPWDVFVRSILTAQGSTFENGGGNFFVLHEDPMNLSETTSQAFLGMSINCAQCHNHPMEKWTNDDYFAMANLFARVRFKSGAADGENIVFVAGSGELIQPLTGRPQPPRPLDGQSLAPGAPEDRRIHLANWLTAPDNPYFSRAIVNRVWANFMGIGLVEAVDDLRATNPASNEKLLSALADHLAGQEFDLKALMRLILQSETYQRSSTPLPENAGDTQFYSRYYPKRLMAEVMLDAISQVTGVPTAFTGETERGRPAAISYPQGWRAIQLPDASIDSYFLKTFGKPDREKTCECERTAEPSISQVLHIANGETINKKLAAPNNRIAALLADKASPETIVEDAYLSALCRLPAPAEREQFVRVLSQVPEMEFRHAVEDVYWAVLSSKEFLFNH